LPTFLYPWLAVAGAVAATVPLIVHLLNRRRFYVVHWAAMDFLREALTRSRRLIELRDLLLLLLRVCCLLAFGLALARPYWSRFSQAAIDPNQPAHAVVLVDNSLSMSYQKPGGILLDDAKAKVKQWMEGLPSGSVISVLPACGPASSVNYQAYGRREDALEALSGIVPVDCSAKPAEVIDRAMEACRRTTNIASRRIYFITDQQVNNWSADAEKEHLKQLPCPIQIEQVATDAIENAWVADVQLRDGIASAECPAVIIATIGYNGSEGRKGIPVLLKVDGKQVASQEVDLLPGQLREIQFPAFDFPRPAKSDETRYATVEVSFVPEKIPFDRLPGDNQRAIVVPVTDSLPVVFIDSLGSHEDAKKRVFGDTRWLQRWLAPQLGQSGRDRPLVQIKHLTIDQLTQGVLADARLVVIAGVARPSPADVLLQRQYVEQGGNLILAAGGDFRAADWSETAWQDGLGILPAPLAPTAVGYARDDRRWATAKTPPLTLDVSSLAHHYFRPEGVSIKELDEDLGPPVYFQKIVVAQIEKDVQETASKAAEKYFTGQRKQVAEIDFQLATLESAGGAPQKIAELNQQREKLQASWLTWKKSDSRGDTGVLPVSDLAERARPQVLATYNTGQPMLVRRQWGRGQVLLLTTSLSPDWTTLHILPQSAWLMDRIARCILSETLTSWNNVDSERGAVLPVAAGERGARFTLIDPGEKQQPLVVDALGGDRHGIGLYNLTQRGLYRVRAERGDKASQGDAALLWEVPLAVNGPAEESQLVPAQKSLSEGQGFVDDSAQAYSALPLQIEGIDLWKWLLGLVLVLLLAELLLAARSMTRREAA
jgi:hypothetical protein